MSGYDSVSFLSDLGTDSETVGVVHSVVRQLAPHVRVIDLTHGIEPFDVRAGSLALSRAVPFVAPGVVIASVDPGVGTARRLVGVEIEGGVFLGPDNGLLAGAVAMVGGAGRVTSLDDPQFQLGWHGPTLAVRDVLAPVAAHLCNGAEFSDLGEELDAALLMPGLVPVARVEDEGLVCEVLWVDRFGNAQLNIDRDDIAWETGSIGLSIGGRSRRARLVRTFDDLGVGEVGLLIDGSGLLSMVASRSSIAEELGLTVGSEVIVSTDDGEPSVVTTAVTLGRSGG